MPNSIQQQPLLSLDVASQTSPISASSVKQESKALVALMKQDALDPRAVIQFYRNSQSIPLKDRSLMLLITALDNHDVTASQIDPISGDLIQIIQSELAVLNGPSAQNSPSHIHTLLALIDEVARHFQPSALLQNDAAFNTQSQIELFRQLLDMYHTTPHKNSDIRHTLEKSYAMLKGFHFDGASEFVSDAMKSTASGFTTVGEFVVDHSEKPQQLATKAVLQAESVMSVLPSGASAKEGLPITHTVNGSDHTFTQGDIQFMAKDGARLTQAELTIGANGIAQCFGDRLTRQVFASIISLGNLPPILVVSPVITYLIDKLPHMKYTRNLYKFAIVSDGVASICNLKKQHNIRLVSTSSDTTEDHYYQTYMDLVEEGYQRIISLHLSPKLSSSYALAKAASQDINDVEIVVVNCHTNGLGLGLIIQEINAAIKHHFSPLDIYNLIKNSIKNLYYLAVPFVFSMNTHQHWLMKIPDSSLKQLLTKQQSYVPLVTLKDNMDLVDVSEDTEAAVQSMVQRLDTYISSHSRTRHIGIEYRGVYQRAIQLKQALNQKYPRIPVTVHRSGTVTSSLFGPELLGVCVI